MKNRRTIRLRGYDYSQEGWYFITICTKYFQEVFGKIIDGKFYASKWGEIVEQCWKQTPIIRPNVEVDVFQIMPNHLHGIIVIGSKKQAPDTGGFPDTNSEPAKFEYENKSIGAIIRGFKGSVTNQIQKLEGVDALELWHTNYYEHIIRDSKSLEAIRNYILQNPTKWQADKEHFEKLLAKMGNK